MKSRLLSFLLLYLLPFTLLAQASITGQVLDVRSNLPLEGVTISTNTGQQTISNESGDFTVTTDAATTLYFTYLGYQPQTINLPVATPELIVYMQPTAAALQEVIVTGYESNRPLLETAGALSIVGSDVISRFDESSLVRAVNTAPGVRMEERAPASYRISIRGSTLRSPYGIRNIKLYFNGIPLTEANGTTALNLLDAASIGSMEILKGPTASIYGAGTGGTILLEPKRADVGEQQVQVGLTTGSYGFRRYVATAAAGSSKSNVLVQYTRQQYDGYREQSALNRHTLLLSPEFYVSDKQTIAANILYTNLYYELPGGITQEQYEQNPRQARGGMFGSVLQQASIDLQSINMGLKQEYRFSNNWRNTTSFYTLHRFRENPFNTDYERVANQELGGRTSFTYSGNLGSIAAVYTLGAEFQRGFEAARTYDNIAGTPDSLRTDDEVIAKTGFVFGQAELDLPSDFILTLALSLNDTKYDITRLKQVRTGQYKYNRNFEAVLSPRVALLKKLTEQISAHASISGGFSPPTEEELLTSDGSLNTNLEAEKGINYETGIRGSILNNHFTFDVVGFYFRLNETIVSRQDVSSVAVFRNVGSTAQKGIEASVGYSLIENQEQLLSKAKLWASYTYSHFRFKEYQKDQEDLSGNKLTGVAPHTLTAGFDLNTKPGFYANLTSNYVDETPLNDENTAFADSYFILAARAGYRKSIGRHLELDAFAGADNITDQKYSLGNDLNAFGGRYYQPAPARNYYGGFTLKYKL